MRIVPEPYTIPVYKLLLVKEGECDGIRITGPESVAKLLASVATSDREQMVCLHLDTKLHAIGRQTVSIGTLNECHVHPREVFKAALLSNAHGIVIAHNHPSGELTPSSEDDEVTRNLIAAGRILGVALLDHVILAPDGMSYSYKNHHASWFRDSSGSRRTRRAA